MNSPEAFTSILKTVDEKAQVELTISNTFMNSQNNDNLEESSGPEGAGNAAENERKLMIE